MRAVPTHVALLRGINLAGKHKVAMADLREIVAALGHDDVATYVQSGNVVFTAGRDATGSELADELERALAERLDFAPAVVVRTRDELAAAIAANPFPGEENPKHVHAVFTDGDPGEDVTDGRDEARVVGVTLYLHTPDGLGRSKLAAKLTRTRGGTARNWSTVTRLLAMLDG
jgi:uncharacterized protein (DUF1697 family)